MKKKLIFILIFFFHSFIYSQEVEEFEKSFGKENATILSNFLFDFEKKILSKKYPNLSIINAYKEYLTDYIDSEINKKDFKSNIKKKDFNNSKIKSLIYCDIDSIYLGVSELSPESNKKAIITKYKCLSSDGEVLNSMSESYCCEDEKGTIELMKKTRTRFQINNLGLFIKSLKKLEEKSTFLEEYLEGIELMGDLRSPLLMSSIILENKYDLNSYFLKRIILLNIVYRI